MIFQCSARLPSKKSVMAFSSSAESSGSAGDGAAVRPITAMGPVILPPMSIWPGSATIAARPVLVRRDPGAM